jgi:gamma-glutamyltranspeptidase/glutathione hydrolase
LNGDVAALAATPLYPASTTFATLDPDGNAVVCAVTMNNLFGTGRMLPGFGFLAAVSPTALTPPLLASGLAWSERDHAFHAEAGGSGQSGAALAAAVALSNSLRSGQPMESLVPEPGRANVISCARYLPGSESSCAAASDPRESGLAAGGGN